jgi:3',5'-cyclic AMP phosphodiesterase CpdA
LFTLAHTTDWHTTQLAGAGAAPFLSKRFFGWLSWNIRRHRVHRPEVLQAMFADIEDQAPDHVAVTGDLTNVALPQEFEQAARLLRSLGTPERVSAIPGNHDAYTAVAPEKSWDLWAPYLASDSAPDSDSRAPRAADFPTLRVRGEIAIVGVCTAIPTPLFQASGVVGGEQLARLESLLLALRERDLFRVVLVHHPITDVEIGRRRRLRDADALLEVLARAGAELVLHGHRHRTVLAQAAGPQGKIPVVGARSASDVGEKEHKRAQYHLYGIERREPTDDGGAGRYRIQLRIRGWDVGSRSFREDGEHELS